MVPSYKQSIDWVVCMAATSSTPGFSILICEETNATLFFSVFPERTAAAAHDGVCVCVGVSLSGGAKPIHGSPCQIAAGGPTRGNFERGKTERDDAMQDIGQALGTPQTYSIEIQTITSASWRLRKERHGGWQGTILQSHPTNKVPSDGACLGRWFQVIRSKHIRLRPK